MLNTKENAVRSQVILHDFPILKEDFAAELQAGLGQMPKRIPPKFFYDRRGSMLFDAICELQEYYLTRADIEIIDTHAEAIADLLGERIQLVEFGSGSSKKIQLLLDAIQPEVYMPIDISREHLLASTQALSSCFPWLPIHAVCADYTAPMRLPYAGIGLRLAAFFPGSSIGNFEPSEAIQFLRRAANMLGTGGYLLVSVDVKKDPKILEAAYNDRRGVTAAFNLNLLHRINRELGAEIPVAAFDHTAFYNPNEGRIEMHLVSPRPQTIRIADAAFEFAAGETIHTENSYKYTVEEFRSLAARAGYETCKTWTDSRKLFSLHCLRVISND